MTLLLLSSCYSPPAVPPNPAEVCVEMSTCYEGAPDCIVVACGSEVGSEFCTTKAHHMALVTTNPDALVLAQSRCESAGGTWQTSGDGCAELGEPSGASFQVEVACSFD